jgi:hypothetical protein
MPRIKHQHTFTFALSGVNPATGTCYCGATIESLPRLPGESRVLPPRFRLLKRGELSRE